MSAPGETVQSVALLDQEETRKRVLNRLKRADGQLGAVIAAVESDADCRTVVTQLSAVSAAIERAGFAVVASGMKRCLRLEDDGVEQGCLSERARANATGRSVASADHEPSLEELEKLFMMLT